ncbi:MAG: hypothetical protein Q4D29_13100 [Lachnospiraceae bacterium]|nr:hypothetical protein [Lachnospiraceae bacterium]
MKKRIRLNKWMILLLIAVTIFAIIAVCKTLLANYVNIRGQHLNTYCYSSGGGMNGGYHSETVKRYSDHALISIESAEWHFQDPTVSEYLVDLAVMDELESVVRKYRMNFWNGKKFTNDFVYDGESEGYHFNFDQEDIFFSSQIYPLRYRKKLNELDRVIDKYIETGEKLPGLVNTNSKINEEENYFLPEGELVVYVYSYVKNSIRLRILNGTDEEIEIPENYGSSGVMVG